MADAPVSNLDQVIERLLLEELIRQWRAKAMALDSVHATMGTGYWQCAKELEAALRAAVHGGTTTE
jgi:hypothetical protein